MTKKKDEHKKEGKDFQHPTVEQDGGQAVPEVCSKETELEEKITELSTGLASANDKYLRLSAEFDNFRKRTLKEKMDLMKNASESVIVNFLPIIDDVERAMKAIELSDNLETTKEGISLIYNKFKDFTKQNGQRPAPNAYNVRKNENEDKLKKRGFSFGLSREVKTFFYIE